MIRLASYQQQLKKGYNKNVQLRSFQRGDLVLRKVLGNTKNPNDGKLGLNQEGQYRVRSVTGLGVYHLDDLNSITLPCPQNVSNLQKYFYQFTTFSPFIFQKKKKREEKVGIYMDGAKIETKQYTSDCK